MTLRHLGVLCAVAGALALGCSGDHGPHDGHDHGAHDHDHGEHGHGESAPADVEAAMAELAPEDRALAEAQETCPVSGEPLGSMGALVKVMVKEKAVFLCCEGCRKTLLKNPDKYLAMLEK